MARLQKIPAPALPYAVPAYTPTYIDQLLKVLRLYFTRLSDSLNAITGFNGGQYIDCPAGLFFSTTDQPIGAANVAQPIDVPIEYLNNAVRVNSGTDSRIYVDIGGVYNFQFSGQLRSGSASSKQVYIWIDRNGTDIGYSTHQYTVSGSGTHLNVSWNFDIDLAEGEYIEMQWASDDIDMRLEAAVATALHPGIPSAVIAVNFVAPLPVPRPTPP
jgi:hypothetical protein